MPLQLIHSPILTSPRWALPLNRWLQSWVFSCYLTCLFSSGFQIALLSESASLAPECTNCAPYPACVQATSCALLLVHGQLRWHFGLVIMALSCEWTLQERTKAPKVKVALLDVSWSVFEHHCGRYLTGTCVGREILFTASCMDLLTGQWNVKSAGGICVLRLLQMLRDEEAKAHVEV